MRSLRQVNPAVHFSQEATLEALGHTFDEERLSVLLEELGLHDQRLRKLPLRLTVLLCIAMNLFTQDALEDVLRKLVQGSHFLRRGIGVSAAQASAICQRRQQLGLDPLVRLFHETCRPLATPATLDAFLFGLRLMALDSTVEEVPDTPANRRTFGCHRGGRGESAFPQVRGVYLCECGTHAICDALFLPYRTSERRAALELLRSVEAGRLLLWDRGFFSYDLAVGCRTRQAHFLGRLKANLRLKRLQSLSDGTYLAEVPPPRRVRRCGAPPLVVRIIEYTLDDPARPASGEVHRLMSSLLDATLYPAQGLIEAYHRRWEIEITIDETDSHQRLPHQPLRSRTPQGVLQELYGLLLAHYAVRKVMYEAAMQIPLAPTRLSFVKTLRALRRAVFEFQILDPAEHAAWYQQLLHDIGRLRLPKRANRLNPRVTKHKMSKFNFKREFHKHWPQPSKPFAQAIVLLN